MKMRIVHLFYLLVVLFFASLVITPTSAICTCDSCTSCWATLKNQSCDVVVLTQDIMDVSYTCIEWPANGKILDCQGHKIDGKDEWSDVGINLNGKSANTIRNCIITDFWYGINLKDSKNNYLVENVLTSNYRGIWLENSSFNTLRKNVIENNSFGIELFNSYKNKIAENKLSSNYEGIFVSGSENTIKNNIIKNTRGLGIHLDDAVDNLVVENEVISNYAGIGLLYAYENTIARNNVSFNREYGIRLQDSTNNLIYDNYFNNTENYKLIFTSYNYENDWNIPKRQGENILGGNWLGGNYWSDYDGEDRDGDGLGDTPYELKVEFWIGPMAAMSADSQMILGKTVSEKSEVEGSDSFVDEEVDYDWLPLVKPKKDNPYAITIHFHYPEGWKAGDPLPEKDITMIQTAKDLNAHYVRFDVWWDEVEPKEDVFNENAVAYFKAIVKEIKKQGMEPLVIVGTHIPDWAKKKMIPLNFSLFLVSSGNAREVIEIPKDKKLKIIRKNTMKGIVNRILGKLTGVKEFRDKIPKIVKKIEKKNSLILEIPANAKIERIPTGKVKVEKVVDFAKRYKIPLKNLYTRDGYFFINMLVSGEFLKEVEEYTTKIAGEMGTDVYYYQLGNEPNHDVLSIIYIFDGPDYIRALYNGINRSDSEFETAINFLSDIIALRMNWMRAVDFYLSEDGDIIDIIGIDHYPGTWDTPPYGDWGDLDLLLKITDENGKKAAVMETGYSTYSWGPINHTEKDQQEFINTAIPAIRERLKSGNLLLICWYELLDEDNPSIPIEIEKHFGILRSDFNPKAGYLDLKRQFGQV